MKQTPILKYVLLLWCLFGLCTSYSIAEPFSDEEVTKRIAFIQEKLDSGTRGAKIWKHSWMTLYSGLTIFQTGMVISLNDPKDKDEEHDRFDNGVGAITSSLGVLDFVLNPFKVDKAAAKLKMCPDGSNEEKREKLNYAEKLLKESSDREKAGRSFKTHFMGILVNGLAGIAVASDDDRTDDGLLTFATGLLVTEIQIFTMPTKAIRDYEDYKTNFSGSVETGHSGYRKEKTVYLSAIPSGLMCTIYF